MAKEISPAYFEAIIEYACMWNIRTRMDVIDLLIELADNPLAVDLLTKWHEARRANRHSERENTRSYINTLLEHGTRDKWLLDENYRAEQEKSYANVLDDLILFPASAKAEKEVEQCNE